MTDVSALMCPSQSMNRIRTEHGEGVTGFLHANVPAVNGAEPVGG